MGVPRMDFGDQMNFVQDLEGSSKAFMMDKFKPNDISAKPQAAGPNFDLSSGGPKL